MKKAHNKTHIAPFFEQHLSSEYLPFRMHTQEKLFSLLSIMPH